MSIERSQGKKTRIQHLLSLMGLLCFILLALGSVDSSSEKQTDQKLTYDENNILKTLENYGKQLASVTPNKSIHFYEVLKTTEKPLRAYKCYFRTNIRALMAEPNAEKDDVAYYTNRGKVEVWQLHFCTEELKSIMRKFAINLISGEIANMRGESQITAICMP